MVGIRECVVRTVSTSSAELVVCLTRSQMLGHTFVDVWFGDTRRAHRRHVPKKQQEITWSIGPTLSSVHVRPVSATADGRVWFGDWHKASTRDGVSHFSSKQQGPVVAVSSPRVGDVLLVHGALSHQTMVLSDHLMIVVFRVVCGLHTFVLDTSRLEVRALDKVELPTDVPFTVDLVAGTARLRSGEHILQTLCPTSGWGQHRAVALQPQSNTC